MKVLNYLAAFILLWTHLNETAASTLIEQLRVDHAALLEAEADFHARRERGSLRGSQLADYAAYVARLYRQVAEDCATLASNAIAVPDEFSCPASPAALISPATINQASEQTTTEKTADLEAQLFSGMSEFDEMLLREQERIKAATPHTGDGAGGGGGSGGEDGGEFADAGAAEHGDEKLPAGENDSMEYDGSAGTGSTQPAAKSVPPPGTPDGSNDDVVARQLREAAEKETDPVLKKKLWEEYRKYKEGTY